MASSPPSMDVLGPLRQSLQRLAQPPAVQVALFPSLALVGDELALGFHDALLAFRARVPEASAAQLAALQRLDDYLSELSGSQDESFWIERIALAMDARWEQVRSRARAALAAFSWPVEAPEPEGAADASAGATEGEA